MTILCIKFVMIHMMILVIFVKGSNYEEVLLSSTTTITSFIQNKTCLSNNNYQGLVSCTKPPSCGRYIADDIFTLDDVTILRNIANKGINTRNETIGGPTIVDINTGYIRDSNGLSNLFTGKDKIYSDEDFDNYGRIIKKLKSLIEDFFKIRDVYFTAPTFITQIKGSEDWSPSEIHDEYWHLHVDNNNTAHYHYSGLLYLSTYSEDFTGGRLQFFNNEDKELEQTIEPKAGRVAIFSSGIENPHKFERVISGTRSVLAFWFTCDISRKFEIFLDGKSHTTFAEKFKKRIQKTEL